MTQVLNEKTSVEFTVPDQMIGGPANLTTPFTGTTCLRIDSTLPGVNSAIALTELANMVQTTADFTVEMYIKDRVAVPIGARTIVARPLVGGANTDFQWALSFVPKIRFAFSFLPAIPVASFSCRFIGATGAPVTCTVEMPTSSYSVGVSDNASGWSHLAAVRWGKKLGIFWDGVGTIIDFATFLPATPSLVQTVGGYSSPVVIAGALPDLGLTTNLARKEFLDELRITNGLARYTANFSPLRTSFPRN